MCVCVWGGVNTSVCVCVWGGSILVCVCVCVGGGGVNYLCVCVIAATYYTYTCYSGEAVGDIGKKGREYKHWTVICTRCHRNYSHVHVRGCTLGLVLLLSESVEGDCTIEGTDCR